MINPEFGDLSDIEHATAIINPVSTTSKQGVKRLQKLITSAPFTIEAIPTSINPNITKAIIAASLEESDLLLIVAGDGTFNSVVDTIVANNLSEQAKRTPIWSLGGGNAEDGYKAKHTSLHRRHPEQVLKDGRIVETYPTRFDITNAQGEKKVHAAAFYATLGATALASSGHFLNSPKHRNSWTGKSQISRSISEPLLVAKALLSAPVNTVMENGEPRNFYDEIFANSHIMAKYLRFSTRLTNRELYHAVIPDRQPLKIVRSFIQGVKGTLPGNQMSETDIINFQTVHPLWSQYDGDAFLIPANNEVSIQIHDSPIRVVVTNPDL